MFIFYWCNYIYCIHLVYFAIYQNVADKHHIFTLHLDIESPYQTDGDIIVSNSWGIRCAVGPYLTPNTYNNQDCKLILTAIYISPNVSMRDIDMFLGRALSWFSILRGNYWLTCRLLWSISDFGRRFQCQLFITRVWTITQFFGREIFFEDDQWQKSSYD